MTSVWIRGVAALLVLTPVLVYAQIPDKIVTCEGVDCTVCDLADTVQRVLNTGIYLVIFLSAVLFAYAGWTYMIAGGDSGKISSAKSIFTNVLIGILIAVASWLVIDTIMKTFVENDGGFGPWNQICTGFADPFSGAR